MTSILVVLMMAVLFINEINSECCTSSVIIKHPCKGIPHERGYFHSICRSFLCYDGSIKAKRDQYCGVGPCNMFGCNCDGGCRRGMTREQVVKAFNHFYGIQ